MSKEEVELLSLYHKAFNDDDVDYNLIKAIVEYIQTEYQVNFRKMLLVKIRVKLLNTKRVYLLEVFYSTMHPFI